MGSFSSQSLVSMSCFPSFVLYMYITCISYCRSTHQLAKGRGKSEIIKVKYESDSNIIDACISPQSQWVWKDQGYSADLARSCSLLR